MPEVAPRGDAMSRGSCLCGAVTFEFDADGIVASVGCFCTNCRKVSGSQYGVYLQVRHAHFRWLSGQDKVVAFESTPGNKRAFCGVCGCVAPSVTNYGAVRVPGGALDDDPQHPPDVLIYTRSRAPWCAIDRTGDAFSDAGPPEFWSTIVRRLYGAP